MGEDDGEAEAGEEVTGCLVVAGGYGASVLAAAERALEDVSGPVGDGSKAGRTCRRHTGEITA